MTWHSRLEQGRIQDFHWGGAAGPGGAILAIEGAPLPRMVCTTTKIMHVDIIIAAPLAPGPYSTHLYCALRLMPDASTCVDL